MSTPTNHEEVKSFLLALGHSIAQKVRQQLQEQDIEKLSSVHKEGEDDTIYTIDREIEEILVPIIEQKAEALGGIFLLAEGIGENTDGVIYPTHYTVEQAQWRIIIDPIDGTRGLMYDKRSAFFLAGAAPNLGTETSLRDIEISVMVELPNSKQGFADYLWAIKNKGAFGKRLNLFTNQETDLRFQPSKATHLKGGFAQFSRFFPPGRAFTANLEDTLIDRLYPDAPAGKTIVFEDQYISTGGQMYELLVGHDRFCADIRDRVYPFLNKTIGTTIGHMCHPYDASAFLILEEAGCPVYNSFGQPFNAPMNLTENIGWMAFANPKLEAHIRPELFKLLEEVGL